MALSHSTRQLNRDLERECGSVVVLDKIGVRQPICEILKTVLDNLRCNPSILLLRKQTV